MYYKLYFIYNDVNKPENKIEVNFKIVIEKDIVEMILSLNKKA